MRLLLDVPSVKDGIDLVGSKERGGELGKVLGDNRRVITLGVAFFFLKGGEENGDWRTR